MPNETPRFTHDCDACRFLGQYLKYDLYVCPQNGHPDYIARKGDEGPDYSSLDRDTLKSVVDTRPPNDLSLSTLALREAMKRHDAGRGKS